MITRWLSFLNEKKIILASGSPQRRVLLKELGIIFEVKTSEFEENLEKSNPDDYVSQTCFKKLEKFLENNQDMLLDIVITADTIIDKDGKIFEKPKNKEEVLEWFSMYSNNLINCTTSTCIAVIRKDSNNINKIYKYRQFITKTVIHFGELSQEIIEDYLETGEPFNKAGGFGIQGLGRTLIKKIEGCYFNVIGLPAYDFTSNFVKLLEDCYGKI